MQLALLVLRDKRRSLVSELTAEASKVMGFQLQGMICMNSQSYDTQLDVLAVISSRLSLSSLD